MKNLAGRSRHSVSIFNQNPHLTLRSCHFASIFGYIFLFHAIEGDKGSWHLSTLAPTPKRAIPFAETIQFLDWCVGTLGPRQCTVCSLSLSMLSMLRLIRRSNVEPKCGNNSSESLHVFLRCLLVPVPPKLRYRLRTGQRSVQLLIVSLLTVPSLPR